MPSSEQETDGGDRIAWLLALLSLAAGTATVALLIIAAVLVP